MRPELKPARLPSPHLLFAIANHRCALPLAHVGLVTPPLPVEPLAAALPCVRGIAIVRGEPLPVVDASRLLGTGDEEQAERFVVVEVGGGRRCVLAVRQVLGVRDLADEPLHELPPLLEQAQGDAVARLALLDAQLWLALDAARLLPAGVPPAGTEASGSKG